MGLLLRVYKLGIFPIGFYVDEARINDGFPMKIVDKIIRPDLSDVYVLLERK